MFSALFHLFLVNEAYKEDHIYCILFFYMNPNTLKISSLIAKVPNIDNTHKLSSLITKVQNIANTQIDVNKTEIIKSTIEAIK